MMAIHPDVQRKVQQELDEVVGRGHLPTAAQSQQLVYLQAVWRESIRMYTPAPLGSSLCQDHTPSTNTGDRPPSCQC